MKGKLIWSLVVGMVAGTMFTMAAPANADVLYIQGTMPASRIITSPVVIEDTPTYVVDTTPVVTTPVYTTTTVAPIMVDTESSHFLHFGLGPLLDFGLF